MLSVFLSFLIDVRLFAGRVGAFPIVAVALAQSPRLQQLLGAGISACCHFSTTGEGLRARFTATELAGPIWIA